MAAAVLVVRVVPDDLASSGFSVSWVMSPGNGAASFRVGSSSVWSSVIAWINRSGFDGRVMVVSDFEGGR